MPNLKRISVSYELNLFTEAIGAAVLLNDQRLDGAVGSATSAGLAATLALTRQRVKLLNLAIRDLIDPALLWCPENAAPPIDAATTRERNPVLVAWSDRKHAKRSWMDWKRAQRRIELNRERERDDGESP